MQPAEFRYEYIVLEDTRYTVSDLSAKEAHACEGTLEKGRVVWLRDKLREDFPEQQVSAYAVGAGVVSIDPRHLKSCSNV